MTCRRYKFIPSLLVIFFASGDALAFDWNDLWQRPDQRAYQLLQNGDTANAAEVFDDPQWRGVSRYRAGDFERAQKEFTSIEGDSALYNQAVTAVQQGEYEEAVEKFETLIERSPDHADGQHNLEIARELAKQQQEQQQQSDQNHQQDGSDQQSENKDQQDQNNSDGEGQSQQSESDSEGGQDDSENTDEQRGGELTADADDARSDKGTESDEQQNADAQSEEQQNSDQQSDQQSEQESQQGGVAEQQNENRDTDDQAVAASQAGPSESEQATEQWLRRIPDDPSQLLRNKIKLNHMIEHADVRDMQEPW